MTGLVIDFVALSNYCHACESGPKPDAPDYEGWMAIHRPTCQKNINCSSNAMEMEGAVILFQRSIQLHRFRYTSMLGDGDSKTHTKLGGKLRNWSAPIVFQNGWAQLAATLLPRKRHKGSR